MENHYQNKSKTYPARGFDITAKVALGRTGCSGNDSDDG